MKKTALFDKHISLGARMVPFAGFEMPVQYTGVNEEHMIVRESVGLFDVSHMGQFLIEGEESESFLQKVTTNNVATLENGKAQYTALPNKNGGIVDDVIIYKIADNQYFMVVNASNIEKDWEHLSSFRPEGVKMTNISDDISLLAIQGPKATEVLQKLTDTPLSEIPFYHFKKGSVAGVQNVMISNTGYTGSGGFEIYFKNSDAEKLWDAVMEAGKEFNILPCGLGARDTLRLEKGFCLYGNDIDDTTSPLEAGLGWITKLKKGDFLSSDIFKKQKEEGVSKKLVGFQMLEKAIPRHGYEVVDSEGNEIGHVTSGTMSPMKKIGIGLAYVKLPFSKIDSEIFIRVRKKDIPAKVVKLPFV